MLAFLHKLFCVAMATFMALLLQPIDEALLSLFQGKIWWLSAEPTLSCFGPFFLFAYLIRQKKKRTVSSHLKNHLPLVQTLFERAILHIKCKLVIHAQQCPAVFRCIYHKFATCYSCQIFYIKYLSSLSHISIQLVKNVKLSPATHQYKHPLDEITLAVNWDPLKRRIQTTL